MKIEFCDEAPIVIVKRTAKSRIREKIEEFRNSGRKVMLITDYHHKTAQNCAAAFYQALTEDERRTIAVHRSEEHKLVWLERIIL